uniref:Uncharacterized protein n=1 Tax=Anguilla anguilla TaxID=7936 RepID=A0A0E9P811_ANGAN
MYPNLICYCIHPRGKRNLVLSSIRSTCNQYRIKKMQNKFCNFWFFRIVKSRIFTE